MRDSSPFDYRPKEFGAFFESKRFEAAADGVEEDVACGFELLNVASMARPLGDSRKTFTYSEFRVNFVIMNVASHVLDLWIEFSSAGHSGGIGLESRHC